MQQHVSDYLGTISSSISSPSDDDSRVHLAQIPGVEGSDYINANFIDVSSAVHVSNAFDSSSRAQYLPSLSYVPTVHLFLSVCLQGYQKKNAFIATQGPLPNTTPDFWRMVWEYRCCCIIMLTNVVEKSRVRRGGGGRRKVDGREGD